MKEQLNADDQELCDRAEAKATGANVHTIRGWTFILSTTSKRVERYRRTLRSFIASGSVERAERHLPIGARSK